MADAESTTLVEEYADAYDVPPTCCPAATGTTSLRYGARIELGLRAFLTDGGFTAFTTNFEDLGGLRQLPGLAVQRLMADGYGFGGEGDWKTSVHAPHAEGRGRRAARRDVLHGGLHLPPGRRRGADPRRAHARGVPVDRGRQAALEIHPLGIGGREDPVRLVFDAGPGRGGRRRHCPTSATGSGSSANEVDVVAPSEPLPNLPVARAVWRPRPTCATATEAWLTAGGPHHTVLSTALTAEHLVDLADMTGTELVLIDADTTAAGSARSCAGTRRTTDSRRGSECLRRQGKDGQGPPLKCRARTDNDMEKSVRRLIATVAGTALALSLAACGGSSGSGSGGDKGTIGVAMPTKSSERWIADGNNIKKQLEAAGYKVDLQYAEDDIPTQVSQVENMVTKGEKMLVVAAIDGTALGDVLSTAKDSNIPVISYDRLIRDTDAVDYYATFDNEKVGEHPGAVPRRRPRRPSGAKAPYNVELFAGSPDDNNATFFWNGAMTRPQADDRLRRHQGRVRPDQVRAGRHPALGRGHGPEAHGGHPHQELHPGDRQRRPLARTTACRSASSRR